MSAGKALKGMLPVALAAFLVVPLASCSDDDPDSTSIITTTQTSQNDFDRWLQANLVNPYNIQFVYRYNDNETDMNYYNVPPDYAQAVELAHIVKYAAVEAYDQVAGVTFTRQYFPKMLYATGEFEYRNNGTMILGTAEGGKKIFLSGVNHLDAALSGEGDDVIPSVEPSEGVTLRYILNRYYLKTIHHEFTHILNQTKDYSTDFQQITGTGYIGDDWSDPENSQGYLSRGFISAYAQDKHEEDFAEMLSIYITNSAEQWQAWMDQAGTSGASLINQKLDIVRIYMRDSWNIDIDKLRDAVLQREQNIIDGKVNLTDLTVK